MTHIKITVDPTANKTTQSAFALNLVALLTQAGASVSVQQEKTGAFFGPTKLSAMSPSNPKMKETEVLIELLGQ